MRKDRVTPDVAQQVMSRDAKAILKADWLALLGRPICIAPLLDPVERAPGKCWGRPTIEHVKKDLRAGKRAESIPERLVTLCEGHTEPGRKAGHQWNTTRRSRELVRDYLASILGPADATDLEKPIVAGPARGP